MDWNEWRRVCTERGLTSSQASESWKNYKDMRDLAMEAALQGYESVYDYENDDEIEEETVEDPHADYKNDPSKGPMNPFVEQVIGAFEELSEQIEAELEEESEPSDEQLFLDMEDHSTNLVDSLAAIKDRIDFYKAKATILQREADEAADDYSKQIRRSLDG